MGWSQQSAMAVEYPHGSPWVHGTRNSLRKSWLEIPFSMIFLANLHVGGFPRLLSTPTTVAVLAPGGRRRKALGSAKICGAAINCWLLGKSIAINCYQISNEYPMNIQWPSLFLGTDSYDSFTLCQIWWLFGSHQPFVRLGGRNNLRMTSRVQMYKCSLCVYSILIHL